MTKTLKHSRRYLILPATESFRDTSFLFFYILSLMSPLLKYSFFIVYRQNKSLQIIATIIMLTLYVCTDDLSNSEDPYVPVNSDNARLVNY